MKPFSTAIIILFFACVQGQQAGTKTEVRPKLNYQTCTKAGGCKIIEGSVTVDANWRDFLSAKGNESCISSAGVWDPKLCPDGKTCAKNCALQPVDYACELGVTSDGENLKLNLITKSRKGRNIGSRLYLLDKSGKYVLFKLKNQEFSFDVLLDKLPCGTNGGNYGMICSKKSMCADYFVS